MQAKIHTAEHLLHGPGAGQHLLFVITSRPRVPTASHFGNAVYKHATVSKCFLKAAVNLVPGNSQGKVSYLSMGSMFTTCRDLDLLYDSRTAVCQHA